MIEVIGQPGFRALLERPGGQLPGEAVDQLVAEPLQPGLPVRVAGAIATDEAGDQFRGVATMA